jgi:NADPH:quinone reductase
MTARGVATLMAAVIRQLAEGAIRPAIGARFALAEVRRAHELIESGTVLGKIVMCS